MTHFIYTKANAVPKNICESIIEFFESIPEHHVSGNTIVENDSKPNSLLKDSTDLSLSVFHSYGPQMDFYLKCLLDILHDCLEEYKETYPFLNDVYFWSIYRDYNVQRYLPGQGYKAWHCENNGPRVGSDRVLAWMIYLNDVPDGGTEFNYELPNLDAKTGTLAIWPAGWTHFHRGIVSETKTKYIVTGWFSYVEESAGGGVKDEYAKGKKK